MVWVESIVTYGRVVEITDGNIGAQLPRQFQVATKLGVDEYVAGSCCAVADDIATIVGYRVC